MNGRVKGPIYDAEFRQLYHSYTICSQSFNFVGTEKFFADNNLNHCQSAKMRILAGKSNYVEAYTAKNLA